MKHRWAARVIVPALCVIALAASPVQGQSSRDPNTGSELKQNYPNPFTTETRIAFSIGGYPACAEPGRQYRVSLRVYNLLAQLVAVPTLQGGSGSTGGGEPVENIFLTCGEYTAYWDGKVQRTGGEASSGIYSYRLEVNGRPVTRKMTRRQ